MKVVTAIDDTPAAHAGIKTGDYISAIDGTSIQGMPLNEAVERMRGPENSKVTLTVLRTGEKKPLELTLTRAVIRVEGAKSRRRATWATSASPRSAKRPMPASRRRWQI